MQHEHYGGNDKQRGYSAVATDLLLTLNGLEESLEVTGTESFMSTALNDLNEHSGAVLDRLGEDLEKISRLVVIDQDVQLLDLSHALCNLGGGGLQAEAQVLIVAFRDGQELHTTLTEVGDSLDDIGCVEGNVLDTSTAIVLAVLGDLGFLLTHGRLVDGHLDLLGGIGHDNRAKGRVLGVDLRVIDRPEAVETKLLLVHLACLEHLTIGLVADAVVNVVETDDGEDLIERIHEAGETVTGQEETLVFDGIREFGLTIVVGALDKGVVGVAIGGNGGHPDGAVLILLLVGGTNRLGALLDSTVVDGMNIINSKGNISDTVAVEGEVVGELLVVGVQRRLEDEGDPILTDNVRADIAGSSLKTAVSNVLETEASGVEGGSLLGIADPEDDVVESIVVAGLFWW